MVRLVAAWLLLAAATLILAPAPAYACSCIGRSTEQLIEDADVIFGGRLDEDTKSGQVRTLTFSVDLVYKGSADADQVVSTSTSTASCGLGISGPGPFVIFANESADGVLRANLCGGTRAGPAPAGLGSGTPPAGASPTAAPTAGPSATPEPQPPGINRLGLGLVILGSAAFVAGAAFSGVLLVKRRARV